MTDSTSFSAVFNQHTSAIIHDWLHSSAAAKGQRRRKYSLYSQLKLYRHLKKHTKDISEKLNRQKTVTLDTLQVDPDVNAFLETWLKSSAISMTSPLKEAYLSCTKTFISRARETCPYLEDASVFQALRNVWITNTLQLFMGEEVQLTNGIFGYSMLYPLTDNLIDDTTITKDQKQKFLQKFSQWLRGDSTQSQPEGKVERDVLRMIQLIESQFDRLRYPNVYESLLCIHRAQAASLKQHTAESLPIEELVSLTFRKGAASVVADGYLVSGDLEDTIYDFLVYYGVLLQLCDDLQDVESDRNEKHQTLFSTFDKKIRFERTQKLFVLCEETLKRLPETRTPDLKGDMHHLMARSIELLISDAVYTQRKAYAYFNFMGMNRHLPLRLSHTHRLKTTLEKNFKGLNLLEMQL